VERAALLALLVWGFSSSAVAQSAPAPAPPAAPALPVPAPPAYQSYPPSYGGGYWVRVPVEPPKERPYQAGTPVPSGYHVEERHPRWALITGTIMLGSAYLTGLFINDHGSCSGKISCNDDRWVMLIPIAGPFIDLNRAKSSSDKTNDVFVGGGQVAGAVLLVVGLATTSAKLVPDYQGAGLRISPVLAAGGAGLTLTLRN